MLFGFNHSTVIGISFSRHGGVVCCNEPGTRQRKKFLLPTISRGGMSDTTNDPALLFTPQKGASNPKYADDGAPESSLDTPMRTVTPLVARDASGTRVYVEIPKLSPDKLAMFQPMEEVIYGTDPDAEGAEKIEEIEGEHTLGSKRFLFARYGDGIVRRVSNAI